jgi:hypothetical protein
VEAVAAAVAVGGGITITITATTMEVVAGEVGTRLQTTITRDDGVRKGTKNMTTADYGSRVREEIPVWHRFQQINIHLHLQPREEIRKIIGAMVGERRQIHREEIHTTPAVMEVGIVMEEWVRMDLSLGKAASGRLTIGLKNDHRWTGMTVAETQLTNQCCRMQVLLKIWIKTLNSPAVSRHL